MRFWLSSKNVCRAGGAETRSRFCSVIILRCPLRGVLRVFLVVVVVVSGRGCFWRVRARRAVPLLKKMQLRKERFRGASRALAIFGVERLGAQAGLPVLLEEKCNDAGRRPAVRTAREKRTMSGCAPSIVDSCCGVMLAQAGMPVLLEAADPDAFCGGFA